MTTASPPLTPQQRAALEARDHSVSLGAGAGCGKTFVLTERFISHLDPTTVEPAAVDELVAITFTDAAAREMRDRIRRRCFARLQTARDDAEAAAWQRLMRSMDAARISTIHAFCTALLRSHAVEAGLDPQFEVLDAPAAELLKLDVIDDRLRTLLVEGNDDVLELAAQRGLDRLRSDLANFIGPEHIEAREKWREATPEQLVAAWREFLDNKAAPLALAELQRSPEMRELARLANPDLAATPKLRNHLSTLASALEASGGRQPPASASRTSPTSDDHAITPKAGDSRPPLAWLAELRSLAMVKGVCTAKDWLDADDFARFRDACKAVRDCIDGSPLTQPLDDEAASQAAALGLALVRLADDVSARLEQAKGLRNQLEFDDLIVRAKTLLEHPENDALREQIAHRVQLLMVDEFQDTNPQQVAIIQAFCGPNWQRRGLFTVGDFKQSIYRFNGAQPVVSTRLRESLPPAGRLSLTTNFRSQPAVLDFVNAVFVDAFADYEPLVPARLQSTATPAVEFLWSPGPNAEVEPESGWHAQGPPQGVVASAKDSPRPAEDLGRATLNSKRRRRGATDEARAEEASWIAARLVQLLASPDPLVVDTVDGQPVPRRLRPGDIAILLRSLGDAQVYEEALRDAGLDYYLAGGHAFYSQQEILDVLNLLRAVASTVDEIALAGALRSPLFALTDETLFWLVDEQGSLNAALAAEELPPQLSPDEAAKVRRAAATLERLRTEKDRLLVAELLALALELTGYDATLLAEFLGPRKAANVEKLIEQARALDAHAPGDLPGFITQLSEFVVRTPKEALAATQSEGNVIRIMTIHYAKGLEFPLVVLPDLERRRHSGASAPVLDLELGPLVPLADREGAVGMDLYRHVEDIEDLEERKRLLYVACTRAADYLILSSGLDDVDRPKSDWLQLVDAQISLADGTLRGVLPPGYRTPEVRVIAERPRVDEPSEGVPRGADLHRLVAKTRALVATPRGIPREALAIAADASARRRFSFSQITGQLAPTAPRIELADVAGEEPAEAPHVVPGDGATGRELGALVHAALQHIDLRNPGDVHGLCEFLAPTVASHQPERLAADAAAVVERFLAMPRAADLAAAPVLRREVEFLLPWPPANAKPAGAKPNGSYLHGYLDCLYQDGAGHWRLIDYKTNRVAARDLPHVAAQYELQLLAYKLACEQALGEPLTECTLVVLHAGSEHEYKWSEADERRGIERITAAINSLTGVPT
jgi:ATP-dependent helicase/nuclease subunit A